MSLCFAFYTAALHGFANNSILLRYIYDYIYQFRLEFQFLAFDTRLRDLGSFDRSKRDHPFNHEEENFLPFAIHYPNFF